METIAFRAWDVRNKKYVTITYLFFMGDGEIEIDYLENSKEPRKIREEEIILEQYTGLKDKTGKEIYEGDIIKVGNTCSFVVYWNTSASFRFNSYMENGLINNLHKASQVGIIIGNIRENPELLK